MGRMLYKYLGAKRFVSKILPVQRVASVEQDLQKGPECQGRILSQNGTHPFKQ